MKVEWSMYCVLNRMQEKIKTTNRAALEKIWGKLYQDTRLKSYSHLSEEEIFFITTLEQKIFYLESTRKNLVKDPYIFIFNALIEHLKTSLSHKIINTFPDLERFFTLSNLSSLSSLKNIMIDPEYFKRFIFPKKTTTLSKPS